MSIRGPPGGAGVPERCEGDQLGRRDDRSSFGAGRLRVVQTIIQVRSKATVGEPKIASGRRPIALGAGTVAGLREYRKRSLEDRKLVGPTSPPGPVRG